MKQIIAALLNIENSISKLIGESENINKDSKAEFENQERLMVFIEEKVYDFLHQAETDIGFFRNDIELLVKYIEFRKVFAFFTHKELLVLIDNENISAAEKHQLIKDRNISGTQLLEKIKSMQKEWNRKFDNISYEKIIARLKIDSEL